MITVTSETQRNSVSENSPRLSFQLMICAEPPELVIATIESLIRTKSADDEILIIDNNNTKKECYEPLAKFCQSLEPALKVRFYHVDFIKGYKAGALNLALDLMDASCSHIVVVDSDYQALPQARAKIAKAIEQYPKHALLQFPQFYRDEGMIEVHGELNHYFNHHIFRRFNQERVLSTGTFAVLRRDALERLGGWSGASITEDAQLGVLMHKQGLQSRFIPEVIATGLLPLTLSDLIKQRQRWIYGNMQVLKQVLGRYFSIQSASHVVAQKSRLNWKDLRAHSSQLSAWVNFTGIFIIFQLMMVAVMAVVLASNMTVNVERLLLPLFVIYGAYGIFLARRLFAYLSDKSPLAKPSQSSQEHSVPSTVQRLKVWALHLSFWELGALSWLPVLWGRDKPFICTPKQVVKHSKLAVVMNNIKALPKLILGLNLVTAALVSPISPLYSPVLFVAALSICALKLWSAQVVLSNYSKAQSEATSSQAAEINNSDYQYHETSAHPVRFGYGYSRAHAQTMAANSEVFGNSETVDNPVMSKNGKAANF